MNTFLNLTKAILIMYVTIRCKGQNTTGNRGDENDICGICKKPCLKLL